MASHRGLKYVLETKKGYVKKDGSYTDNVEEALLIDFMQFGFGPNPIDVFNRLGFIDKDISNRDVRFNTIVSSYECRDTTGSYYYEEMGYQFKESMDKARHDYFVYNLSDDNNYINYVNNLKKEVINYKKKNSLSSFYINDMLIYEVDKKEQIINNGILKEYCLNDKIVYSFTVPLKNPHVENYFDMNDDEINYFNHFQQDGLINYFKNIFNNKKFEWDLKFDSNLLDIQIKDDKLILYLDDFTRVNGDKLVNEINNTIRDFYSSKEMHITRIFGSYILLIKENGELKAKYASNIPIKYCPLMVKLLKEVGGNTSDALLDTLKTEDKKLQREMMCNLVNETVIKSGYFDTSRPLNSCEANVTFGASETMYSAFLSNLIDASVIVSNNLGTIITTNAASTQGAVKRMTGLFYTSPNKEIINTALSVGIIPVFPYSADIDQLEGVKKAIELGYKRIAVSVAADNNYIHEYLKELETQFNVKIYKFGLCSTGINEKTAETMRDYSDVVWSCASKNVKTYIEPNSIAQVGIKIPVHIMTSDGWEIVKNHLYNLDNDVNLDKLSLIKGEEKPIILNSENHLKVLKKKEIKECSNCPHPCV